MKRECIEELIRSGREIEFRYRGGRYSITYYNDEREKGISVCKFYGKPIDVADAEEVFGLTIGGVKLEEIFAALPDSAFDIY